MKLMVHETSGLELGVRIKRYIPKNALPLQIRPPGYSSDNPNT